MKYQILNSSCLALLAVAAAGCADLNEAAIGPADGQLSNVNEPILNGTPVGTDVIGSLAVYNSITGMGCSAAVLSDRWIVTAHHCVSGDGQSTGSPVAPSQIGIIVNNAWVYSGVSISVHPTSDVALVKLDQAQLDANGHPRGTPLFLGRSSDLNGQTLYCESSGDNTLSHTGWGTLRYGYSRVYQLSEDGFRVLPSGNPGTIPFSGDSGGGCYVFLNGRYYLAGINDHGAVDGSSTHLVGIEKVAAWIQGILGNAVAVFSDPGFKGNTQQVVAGGPNSGRFDISQLVVGNDAISSYIIPSSYQATFYRDPGFATQLLTGSNLSGNASSSLNDQISSISVVGGAKFYTGTNFTGSVRTQTSAGTVYLTGTNWDNVIRSLTVPTGWTVTLFENGTDKANPGASATFTEGSYDLIDAALDSKVSYMVVREPAVLYGDANYGSGLGKLVPGCYDTGQLEIPNDWASSLFVPSGLRVQLFQDGGLRGTNTIYTQSSSYLGSWNDRTSGACVYAQPTAWCGSLRADEALLTGNALWSCDKRFYLTMQSDGNLVLYQYQNGNSTALWSSGTWQTSGNVAFMQDDGNFVLYDANRNPLWSSNTWGWQNSYLAVQDDGNLVVYNGTTPLWDSQTCCR